MLFMAIEMFRDDRRLVDEWIANWIVGLPS
jgi:hypothetical protein